MSGTLGAFSLRGIAQQKVTHGHVHFFLGGNLIWHSWGQVRPQDQIQANNIESRVEGSVEAHKGSRKASLLL